MWPPRLIINPQAMGYSCVLFVALCAACGGTAETQPPLLPVPPVTYPLGIAATDGTLTVEGSDFSLQGQGTARIGSISIDHGWGQVELDGRMTAASSYVSVPFSGFQLHQTLAVESDRIWVLFFYCSDVDQSLSSVYYENTDGAAGAFEDSTGTCTDTGTTATLHAQFPAVELPPAALVPGFKVRGPSIQLDGASPGVIVLKGVSMDLLVFATVDCTDCGNPGWSELHSLIWDQASATLSFTIIYLLEDDFTDVQLAYSLTLPELTDPIEGFLPASWSRPASGSNLTREGPHGRQVTVPPAR
jgi:hypothetical protein